MSVDSVAEHVKWKSDIEAFAGAPANFKAKRTAWVVTLWATPIWAIMAAVILFSGLSIREMDPWKSFRPQPLQVEQGQ